MLKCSKILILLSSFFMFGGAYAKSPPPGSGSLDVPTNIMIMLDKSGSMNLNSLSYDMDYPYDLAFDSVGNVYVANKYENRVSKFDPEKQFIKEWGEYGDDNGQFNRIYAIDIDSDDRVYVSDEKNDRVQIFDSEGNYLSKIELNSNAKGIAIDKYNPNYNLIYILDRDDDINVYNKHHNKLRSFYASSSAALLAVDKTSDRNVYVTDKSGERVYKYDKYGNKVYSFEGGSKNYISTSEEPFGIDVDEQGYIYISGRSEDEIFKYNSQGILISTYGSSGSALGQYSSPRGIAVDNEGNVWVSDAGNDRIQSLDGTSQWPNGGTRMEQAKNVIKDIVSDSSLNSGAHFGLLPWGSSDDAYIEVPISKGGAGEIYETIDSIEAYGSTYLGNALSVAKNYMTGANSPMTGLWCQNNILIVISDGIWFDHYESEQTAEELYEDYNIKTFVVGFNVDSGSSNALNYIDISQAGGTYPDSPVFANNWKILYDSISQFIIQTINSTLTFSTPTIVPQVNGKDHILQSIFKYKNEHQWKGYLNKYSLDSQGYIDELEWEAGSLLAAKAAVDRKIWTVNTELDISGYNNFIKSNLEYIRPLITAKTGFAFNDQDLENLIDYVRGVDVYNEFSGDKDDEGDDIIDGERWKLADIYHSIAVSVGVPSAFVSDETSDKTEAYYRYINGYKSFIADNINREEVIYVGSNAGMLHAFDSSNGNEKWAFIPPSIASNFIDIIPKVDEDGTILGDGGSRSIYGVDGSPVVKDVFYNGQWKTILVSGARQGGKTYFALDVTDPNNPLHLFTFEHNTYKKRIHYWDNNGAKYSYRKFSVPDRYDYRKIGESWSRPIILRLPVGENGAYIWTAVFGGGYNSGVNKEYGSYLFIINLEDGGKVIKIIEITDENGNLNTIRNSVPTRISAITADSSVKFRKSTDPGGAVIYMNDLEGKLWKINLTDQGTLYEKTKIYDVNANSDNARYSFHEDTISIDKEGYLWHFYGTGDLQALGDINANIQNKAYGFKTTSSMTDFVSNLPQSQSNLFNVDNEQCSLEEKEGWYFNLGANEKITSKSTIRNGYTYFSRYKPNGSDGCATGLATISEHNYKCGNLEDEFELGGGVPTQSIIYKNKIYLGVSTDQEIENLPDGWVKQGNLIIGVPSNLAKGKVSVESWWEDM